MNGRTPQQLFPLLTETFSLSELRTLAFSLNVDPENLSGDTKEAYALSLVTYAKHRNLITRLNELVDEKLIEKPLPAPTAEVKSGGKTAVWLIVAGALLIILAVILWPETEQPGPGPDEDILLQVQVVNSENLTMIFNAKVSLDIPGELIPPQRTDSNGRAVFSLDPETDGNLARITVETSEVKVQNIPIKAGMGVVEFQIRP